MSAFEKVKLAKSITELVTKQLKELIPDLGFFSVSKNDECHFFNVFLPKDPCGFQRVLMVWVNASGAGVKYYHDYVMEASDEAKIKLIAEDLVLSMKMR